jgi:hypothetical protein
MIAILNIGHRGGLQPPRYSLAQGWLPGPINLTPARSSAYLLIPSLPKKVQAASKKFRGPKKCKAEISWEFGKMTPTARREMARNVLRLWRQTGSYFRAGEYIQVVWERAFEADKRGEAIDVKDLPVPSWKPSMLSAHGVGRSRFRRPLSTTRKSHDVPLEARRPR